MRVSNRDLPMNPLVAKTGHAAHQKQLSQTGCSSANRGPNSCKHRSSHDTAAPSTAAGGVVQ